MKIGIIGLGLIGGSLAMSIRRHTEHTVFGFDIDPQVMLKARAAEAIHDNLTDDLLPGCGVIRHEGGLALLIPLAEGSASLPMEALEALCLREKAQLVKKPQFSPV